MTPHSTSAAIGYRKDIDGLRAVAVLAVLVYHAFPSALPGGFIGVDIFFVISGYLISRHIMDELATSSFNLSTFYSRRVRRIFPALILVLVACLGFGWLMLTPGEYERLGRHVFAGALFLANILSWREAGYFDTAADTKPLLHLWSLGIEEQFYIAWPLILALLWRVRRWLGWGMAGLIGLSLAWSLCTVRYDLVANFYSPLTRFWELAVGAMLAWLAQHRRAPALVAPQATRLSWLGLTLLVVALLLIDSSDAFPGAWALLPTLGSALLIQAGPNALPNQILLAWRPMVWIGLISYPLYLWHWPLLTYARILEGEIPAISVRWMLLVLSFLLAWLTWRYVERPVRARTSSRAMIWGLCLTMVVVGVAGFVVKSAHGYRHRLAGMMNGDPTTMVIGADRGLLRRECGIVDAKKNYGLSYCLQSGEGEPRAAVFGDSKAEALYYGLVRESPSNVSWVLLGSAHPPEPDELLPERLPRKGEIALQHLVASPSIRTVVITVAMRGIFRLDPATGFIINPEPLSRGKLQSYSLAIRRLEAAGKQVVFVIDHPTFPDPTSCVSGGVTGHPWLDQVLRRKANPYCTVYLSDHLRGTAPYKEFVEELKLRHPGLHVYDPTPLMCDVSGNVCQMTSHGRFLYSYGDHISDHASAMMARELLQQVGLSP